MAEPVRAGQKAKFRWLSGKGFVAMFGILIGISILYGMAEQAIDPEGYAARQNERQIEQAVDRAIDEVAASQERREGVHCLSEWDGANRSTIQQLKDLLRDPDSFVHVETRILPLDEATGEHGLWMTYRAKNGFGGVNVSKIYARVNSDTCEARLLPDGPGSD